MRKNDLIKLLQTIEGNPEIVLWNGFVQDYQDISKELVKGKLVKLTLDWYLETCRMKRCIDEKDWKYKLTQDEINTYKNYYKDFKYGQNNYVTEEDIKAKRYRVKKVVYLDAKLSNKTYHDRLGSVKY